MQTYAQTLAYMFNCIPMFHLVGAAAYKANLDNTLALSKLCRAPEQNFPSVHIAGTNGKGSVSHILASVLQESGFKTGLYTSPHLKDFRERIRINGKMIPKKRVVKFVYKYKKDFETIQPSFFEITFALAMEYFSEQKVDIAVVETGMGGRLDSTNTVRSILSLITNISLDHTQFLGNKLPLIAKEKAGIIKPGVPVVIGKTQDETKEIFAETAKKLNAEILFADRIYKTDDFSFSYIKPFGSVFNMQKNGKMIFKNLYCPLSGNYQQENLQTVFASVDILNKKGFNIDNSGLIEGIENVSKNTGLKGRWQVLTRKPLTICDTAHNTDGLTQVVKQIKQLKFNKLHFVFGMVNDKDISGILNLLPKDATYYFCKPDIPRGLDITILKKKSALAGLQGKTYNSISLALKSAREKAGENDMIFVGGSTFVVAEVV